MDIEINAQGRMVRITGIECDNAEDCAEVAIKLWRKTKSREAEREKLGGAIGFQLEKSFVDTGPAYLVDGERPVIK